MQQIDAIFSKCHACGGKAIATGARPASPRATGASKPISLYGRNSASGTYGYFKEHALCNGDYKDTVKEQPGSASVVQGVAEDKFGIGYSGIGYKTSGVRAVPLPQGRRPVHRRRARRTCYAASIRSSRFLYVYVNKAPNKPLDPLVREFSSTSCRSKARRRW